MTDHTVLAGGREIKDGILLFQHNVYTHPGLVLSGNFINAGQTEYVLPHGSSTSATIETTGTLVITAGGTASDIFFGATSGYDAALDVASFAYASGGKAIPSGTTLTVSEGGRTTTLQLGATYNGYHFGLSPDAGGGMIVSLRVGDVPAEHLAHDLARTPYPHRRCRITRMLPRSTPMGRLRCVRRSLARRPRRLPRRARTLNACSST